MGIEAKLSIERKLEDVSLYEWALKPNTLDGQGPKPNRLAFCIMIRGLINWKTI